MDKSAALYDEMIFADPAPKWVPVTLGSKLYRLYEASADAARQYRNKSMEAAELSGDGKFARLRGMADCEPLLVSLCLVEVYEVKDSRGNPQEKTRPVGLKEILTKPQWTSKVVKALFERCKAISGLGEKKPEVVAESNGKVPDDSSSPEEASAEGEDEEEDLPDPTTVPPI